LGLTGGTLDKLEAIEGFRVNLTTAESDVILREVGTLIMSASERIAPADRKLYALRDVTGTVESIALITASILSKKLAANLDALVMDVKVGSGAFMKSIEQATELAQSLVRVGSQAGLPTSAILSDMSQPLGQTIGNAIEVNETIEVLAGRPGEVRDLTMELAADVLMQAEVFASLEFARAKLAEVLDSGQAMERFERMVHAQGGRLDCPLDLAPAQPILAARDGFLAEYDCEAIGEAVVAMGGGRRKQEDPIDHSVGIRAHGRIGDEVQKGQPILTVHGHNAVANDYLSKLADAVFVSDTRVPVKPLILTRIGAHRGLHA
jgi:pyrimidine-nucleoside phosphorylase